MGTIARVAQMHQNPPDPAIRGRGVSENPANRFVPIAFERDGDFLDDPNEEHPQPSTQFYRDTSRTIIAYNTSPDVGFTASINPYRGCEHGCVYCLAPDTPILMADGTTRALEQVRVGDHIYGTERRGWYRRYVKTTVLAHWATEQPAHRVVLEDGTELNAGPNHRFLTERGWKFVTPSRLGQRPYLTANNKLMGTGAVASPSAPRRDEEYRRGYLCGLIRGDGLLGEYRYDGRRREWDTQHHFRLAMADEPALDRASEFLGDFGVATRAFLFQPESDRRRCTHAIRTHARASVERVRHLVAWPLTNSDAWRRGFLAGIYDAEGCYSDGTLRISNIDGSIIDQIADSLRSLGFEFAMETARPSSTKPVKVVRMRGGMVEHWRFFHGVDPAIRRIVTSNTSR